MRKTVAVLLLGVMLFSSTYLATETSKDLAGQPVLSEKNSYNVSTPFRINSKAEFAAMAISKGWPGDGSQGNPYIIDNYDINGAGYGYCIYVGNTTCNFTVQNCYLHEASGNPAAYFGDAGIYLYSVQNGNLTKNRVEFNDGAVFQLNISSYNNISFNNASLGGNGIYLYDRCNNNIIKNNTVFDLSSVGIYIQKSSKRNTIINNTVSNNMYGIYLQSLSDPLYIITIIANNTVSDNDYGIYLYNAICSAIYYNQIINNTNQAYDNSHHQNLWNLSYPFGNYWSDYTGTDGNGDGIGDTPYVIDADSQDNYPLMHPWDTTLPTATATGPQGAGHDPIITISYNWTGNPTEVDLYYSTNHGDSWNYLGTDTTVDGSFDWTPECNPGPKPSKFYWIANAKGGTDDVGIPANDTDPEAGPYNWKTFDVNTGGNPARDGSGYWTFISVPLTVNGNITTVFDDALYGDGGTTWDYAMWYDASDMSDPWKSYMVNRPASLNDMPQIDNTMGIWLHITSNGGDGVLTAGEGIAPVSTNISLRAGWNLVGYPTLNSTVTVGNAFLGTGADRVEVFDPADPYGTKEVGPTYIMKPGEGYWIHVPSDAVWTVNW